MTKLHDPGNVAPIETVYAYLSVDEAGNEGICAGLVGGLATPLVAGNRKTAALMMGAAKEIARKTDKRVILVRYLRGETIEIIKR